MWRLIYPEQKKVISAVIQLSPNARAEAISEIHSLVVRCVMEVSLPLCLGQFVLILSLNLDARRYSSPGFGKKKKKGVLFHSQTMYEKCIFILCKAAKGAADYHPN